MDNYPQALMAFRQQSERYKDALDKFRDAQTVKEAEATLKEAIREAQHVTLCLLDMQMRLPEHMEAVGRK